jgi:hypothetical protein
MPNDLEVILSDCSHLFWNHVTTVYSSWSVQNWIQQDRYASSNNNNRFWVQSHNAMKWRLCHLWLQSSLISYSRDTVDQIGGFECRQYYPNCFDNETDTNPTINRLPNVTENTPENCSRILDCNSFYQQAALNPGQPTVLSEIRALCMTTAFWL